MKLGHKDFDIYKRILIIVHDKVMPNLSRFVVNIFESVLFDGKCVLCQGCLPIFA